MELREAVPNTTGTPQPRCLHARFAKEVSWDPLPLESKPSPNLFQA
jgi:hypothetical protein